MPLTKLTVVLMEIHCSQVHTDGGEVFASLLEHDQVVSVTGTSLATGLCE